MNMGNTQNSAPGNGKLDAYWEQGWEGRVAYSFLPDRTAPPIAPRFLENGDLLRIYSPDNSVLWEGTVRLVPRRKWLFFRQKHDLDNDIWNGSTQAGVPYRDWIRWFWKGYRAELSAPGAAPATGGRSANGTGSS